MPFDEMLKKGEGVCQPYEFLKQWLVEQDQHTSLQKTQDAERVFRKTGVTFAVHGDEEAAKRLIPFDIIRRIISGQESHELSQDISQDIR